VYGNADADADAAALEGRRVGRPSLASGVSPQVSFRVPTSVKAKLKAVALDSGRTEAAIAREALERFLDAAKVGTGARGAADHGEPPELDDGA
jgi:hypothetical protein